MQRREQQHGGQPKESFHAANLPAPDGKPIVFGRHLPMPGQRVHRHGAANRRAGLCALRPDRKKKSNVSRSPGNKSGTGGHMARTSSPSSPPAGPWRTGSGNRKPIPKFSRPGEIVSSGLSPWLPRASVSLQGKAPEGWALQVSKINLNGAQLCRRPGAAT